MIYLKKKKKKMQVSLDFEVYDTARRLIVLDELQEAYTRHMLKDNFICWPLRTCDNATLKSVIISL